MNNEEMTVSGFQIIAKVGESRSRYLEAIRAARVGDFEQAGELVSKGEVSFNEGHAAHFKLIQQEANGDPVDMNLILTHAEDQLMSAESFGILAEEFIELYHLLDRVGIIVRGSTEDCASS